MLPFQYEIREKFEKAAKEIGYSPMNLVQSLSFLKQVKNSGHYHVVESAIQDQPTYEQLLEKLKLTKQRIKELLAISENPHIDCPGLRHEYKE